jgi:uncharacterized protein DUF6335
MAKRAARRGGKMAKATRKSPADRRSAKRPNTRSRATRTTITTRMTTLKKRKAAARKRKPAPSQARTSATTTTLKNGKAAASKRELGPSQAQTPAKAPRLYRDRRTLEEPVPGPPSSLDMDRRGSAARTGRAELAEARQDHATMTPAITGGDVDANLEAAYFSGDEAPGGDNPTPDQDVVDEIGKALGVEYQDNEELKPGDKVGERDKHRWELDPASSEDYPGRK